MAEAESARCASHITIFQTSCRLYYFRSEEHTSELQSRGHLVCRLLLEKKNHAQEQNIATKNPNRSPHTEGVIQPAAPGMEPAVLARRRIASDREQALFHRDEHRSGQST